MNSVLDKNILLQPRFILFLLIFLITSPLAVLYYYGFDSISFFYSWKSNNLLVNTLDFRSAFYLGYALISSLAIILSIILIYDLKISSTQRNENIFLGCFSIIISALFLGVLLLYGPINTETYSTEITSGLIRIRHFFSGQLLTWYDGRGFGTPFPTIQSPDTHPLFLLSKFFPFRITLSLIWVFHLTIGCFFFSKICRLLNLEIRTSLICAFCYVFSMPTILGTTFYNFTTVFIAWSMYPVIIFFVFKLFINAKNNLNYSIFLLPILLAFTFINSLPSVSSHFLITIAIGVFFGAIYVRDILLIRNFIIVLILASLLASPNVFYIANELSFFPTEVVGSHAQQPTNIKVILGSNFSPLNLSNLYDFIMKDKAFSFQGIFDNGIENMLLHNPKKPFLGGVFLILALCTIVITIFSSIKINARNDYAPRIIICTGLVIGIIGSILPSSSPFFFDLISPESFSHEMIFFGILSAGIAINYFSRGWFKNFKRLQQSILAFQTFQVLGYTSFIVFFYPGNPYITHANFFEAPRSGDALYEWLLENKNLYGDRILLSPEIESDLFAETALLKHEKFYSIPGINLHTDINVVNDMFKGISMDRIQPPFIYTHGHINSNYDLMNNRDLLHFLGINWIVLKDSELKNINNTIENGEFIFSWKDERWVIQHLEKSWDKVFALSKQVSELDPTYRADCGNTKALCLNISPFLDFQKNIPISVEKSNGFREINFDPQNENFILGLSTMYRPEWTAVTNNGEELNVKPILNAFIGIEIPAGVSSVSLNFYPKTRIGLTYLSIIVLLVCIGFLIYSYSKFFEQRRIKSSI